MAKEFNHDSIFQGTVQITSGTPAVNKVLLSDATGNATWQPVPVPTIALTDVNVVADETAQLALTVQEEGDVAIRLDENTSYVHNGGTAGTMADWSELLTPASPNLTGDVTSVGSATTISAKAVDIAMISDGVDGELITWDSSGVATTVSTGTVGQVLTSAGAGAEPTFQTIETVQSATKTITTVGGVGFAITHGLGTDNLHVSTYDSAGNFIGTEVNVSSTLVTITTAVAEVALKVVISTAPNVTAV